VRAFFVYIVEGPIGPMGRPTLLVRRELTRRRTKDHARWLELERVLSFAMQSNLEVDGQRKQPNELGLPGEYLQTTSLESSCECTGWYSKPSLMGAQFEHLHRATQF